MKRQEKKEFRLQHIRPVSDFNPRQEWENYTWKTLLKYLREMPEILERLVSPSERHNIIQRAAAITYLRSGASYKQIGRELWLAPQTISTIKKSLTENKYQSAYQRQVQAKLLRPAPRPATVWDERRNATRIYRRTKYGRVRMP